MSGRRCTPSLGSGSDFRYPEAVINFWTVTGCRPESNSGHVGSCRGPRCGDADYLAAPSRAEKNGYAGRPNNSTPAAPQ